MVREWAHNPTLNGSIPNSSLILKLKLTKQIFKKNKIKLQKTRRVTALSSALIAPHYIDFNYYIQATMLKDKSTSHSLSTVKLLHFIKVVLNTPKS